MTTFYVKSRRSSPILYSSVEAETREEAVAKTVDSCPPEEQVDVLEVSETAFEPVVGPSGPSGATGGTRGTHSKS